MKSEANREPPILAGFIDSTTAPKPSYDFPESRPSFGREKFWGARLRLLSAKNNLTQTPGSPHPHPSGGGRAAATACAGLAGGSVSGGVRGKTGLDFDKAGGRCSDCAQAIAQMGRKAGAMSAEIVCEVEKSVRNHCAVACLTAP